MLNVLCQVITTVCLAAAATATVIRHNIDWGDAAIIAAFGIGLGGLVWAISMASSRR